MGISNNSPSFGFRKALQNIPECCTSIPVVLNGDAYSPEKQISRLPQCAKLNKNTEKDHGSKLFLAYRVI